MEHYSLGLHQLSANISQGHYANCYFIAALISLAQTPEIIRTLFLEDPEKSIVRIRLFDEYRWRQVKVNIDINSVVWNSLSCTATQGYWTKALEIAWSCVRGGFDRIERASPYEAFLGLTAAPFEILSADCEDILKYLQEDLKKGYSIIASSNQTSIDNIHSCHSYSILEVSESDSLIFKLKDPWGNSSPVPDAILELTGQDLIRYFSHFTICKTLPDYLHTFFTVKKPNKNCLLLKLSILHSSNYYILLYSKKPHIPIRFTLWTDNFSLISLKSNINSLPCIWEFFNLDCGTYYIYLEFYTPPTALSLATYSKHLTLIQQESTHLDSLRQCLYNMTNISNKPYLEYVEVITDEYIQTYGSCKYRKYNGKNIGVYVYSLKDSTGYYVLYVNCSEYPFRENLSVKSDGLEEHSDTYNIFLNAGEIYRIDIRSKTPQWKIRLTHKHIFKITN